MSKETTNDNIIIRPLLETDWDALCCMCDRRLGKGYLDYEDFLFRVEYPELNLVAEENGRPIAMVSMTPEDPRSLADAVKMDYDELLRDAGGRETIHFRTAICDEIHHHTGLTQSLLERVISNARRLGYGVILSPTWKYNGCVPALKLQTNLGFKIKGERHMLWYNQKGYTCIICNGPCRCDAVLMELIL